MEDNREVVSLLNLKDGAAVEMFNIAIQKVIENISDINTALSPREIILKVKLVPSDDRTLINYTIKVDTKLIGQPGVSGSADIKINKDGRMVCYGRSAKQLGFGFKNKNVVKI
jgi:hypothetical protein